MGEQGLHISTKVGPRRVRVSCHNVQVFKKCVKEQYLQTYDLN